MPDTTEFKHFQACCTFFWQCCKDANRCVSQLRSGRLIVQNRGGKKRGNSVYPMNQKELEELITTITISLENVTVAI